MLSVRISLTVPSRICPTVWTGDPVVGRMVVETVVVVGATEKDGGDYCGVMKLGIPEQSGCVSSSPFLQLAMPSQSCVLLMHPPPRQEYSLVEHVQFNSSVWSMQSGTPSHTRVVFKHWQVDWQENLSGHMQTQPRSSEPSAQSL